MKKYLFAIAALAFMAAACSKQENKETPGPSGPSGPSEPESKLVAMSFNAGKEGFSAPVLRSTIDGSSILWESSDEVAVYDGVDRSVKRIFTVTPGAPASNATLNGEAESGSEDFYAVYPAAAAAGVDGSSVTVSVPAAQVIPAGKNVDPAALVSVAYASKGEGFGFRNVCGYLKLEVTYANIKSITVEGSGIAGSASVEGATGIVSSKASASDVVTLTYEGGALFPVGSYYVTLLPGSTAAEAFKVSMTQDIAGFTATETSGEPVEIERNGGFDFGALDTKVAWTYLIGTADELLAWNARHEEWQPGDQVKLTADIDMSGKTWTMQDFHGTFDGQDHRIYNLAMSAESANVGFFFYLHGTLKNVVFGSSDGSTHDGTSEFRLTGTTDGSTWRYMGIVIRLDDGAAISNVTSFMNMIIDPSADEMVRLGGIAGISYETNTIDHCYFRGKIEDKPTEAARASGKTVTIGGILSFNSGQASISDCANYGSIESTDGFTYSIGGILGCNDSGACAVLNTCLNSGVITCEHTVATLTAAYVGGVAGYINGNNVAVSQLTNCSNTADLNISACPVNRFGGIVGAAVAVDINACTNSGAVRFAEERAGAGYQSIGGIAGYFGGKSSIINCINNGAVETHRVQVNCVGGIAGVIRAGNGTVTVSGCTNNGSCLIRRSGNNANWQACGGIVGEEENSVVELSGNTNNGPVSIDVNNATSHKMGLSCGGLIGLAVSTGTITLSGNNNFGDVSLKNIGTQTQPQQVGGLAGYFNGANCTSSGDKSVCAVSRDLASDTGGIGAAVGNNLGSVTNPILGGSVNGVVLDAGNVESLAIGTGTGSCTGASLAQ